MEVEIIKEEIQKTLQTQIYGVFNTVRNEQPHSALVGFAITPDFSKIIILTPKNTRKYINTQLNQKVNLFISTSTNNTTDLDQAVTISIIGKADVSDKIDTGEKEYYLRLYFEKNTHMKSIADKLESMIIISVETFELTTNYQKSIIQTSTDKSTLIIRQLPGIPVVKGIARGKAVILKSLNDIHPGFEKMIIVVNSIEESDVIPVVPFAGLVVKQNTIPSKIETYVNERNIPTLKAINERLISVQSGDELSINGNLGVIIFHKIK